MNIKVIGLSAFAALSLLACGAADVVPTAPSALQTQYNRVMNAGYEDGSTTSGYAGITNDLGVTASVTVARRGRYAIKSEVRDTDPMELGGVRSESAALSMPETHYFEGTSFYYGFSVYVPGDWADDGPNEDILFQWKRTSAAPDSFLCIKRKEFYVRSLSAVGGQALIANISAGWNDFVFYYKWSSQSDGALTVWYKRAADPAYAVVVNNTGANMDMGNPRSIGYFKWGLYTPKWNDGRKTSVSHRIVFHDNVRLGRSFEEADPAIE
jgi:Polysaccharide lyase